MKKENRKMAQERRAKERRKKEMRRRISKIIVITLPLIAVIALIIAIILTSDSSGSDTSSGDSAASSESGTEDTSGTEDASGTDDSADSASYSTDTSLTVEDGDTVNIDYVGSVDGVEFDGGNTQGMGTDLVIGSGSYIDDFEEQLIGSHPGDQVEVTVTFPEDYGNEELNGKEAVFDVTVNGIYE